MQIVFKPQIMDSGDYEDSIDGILDHLSIGIEGLDAVRIALEQSDMPLRDRARMLDFVNDLKRDCEKVHKWVNNTNPCVDFDGEPILYGGE